MANKNMKEEAGGTTPTTPKEKALAKLHGNPNKITMGDVMKGRGIRKEGWDDMLKAAKERRASEGTGKFDKKATSTGTVYTRKSETFDDGGKDADMKKADKKMKKEEVEQIAEVSRDKKIKVKGSGTKLSDANDPPRRQDPPPGHAPVAPNGRPYWGEGVEQADEGLLDQVRSKTGNSSTGQKPANKSPNFDSQSGKALHATSHIAGLRARVTNKLHSEAKDTPGNGYEHQCAIHVKSEQFGEGKTLFSQHADPDADGYIAWYDVMFAEGIKRVNTKDIEVLEAMMHGNHTKKK
jgi:hypothetical protein